MESQLILWMLGLIGGLLMCAVTYILNDIRQSIRDIKSCLHGLREDITAIDKRVVRLELRRHAIEQDEFNTYSSR